MRFIHSIRPLRPLLSHPLRSLRPRLLNIVIRGLGTGTVKHYNAQKGFGHIVPDDSGNDIFVHRSSIKSDLSIESHLRNPFLRKGERVRFDVTTDDQQRLQAKDVTWLDGSPILPLRSTFLGSIHDQAYSELGAHVYRVLQKKQSDASEQIQFAYQVAQAKIQQAEDLIEKVGMRVEDFPIHKKIVNGKPKYFFEPQGQTNEKDEEI